jgi:methylmalonyl-CoA mutase
LLNENQEKDDRRRALLEQSDHFASHEGRRPRLMIATLGEGLNAEVIKTSNEFADLGFDVDIAPALDEVQLLLKQVVDNDAHILLVLMRHSDSEKYHDIVRITEKKRPEEVLLVFKSEEELDSVADQHLKGTGAFFGSGASVYDLAKYMLGTILRHG